MDRLDFDQQKFYILIIILRINYSKGLKQILISRYFSEVKNKYLIPT